MDKPVKKKSGEVLALFGVTLVMLACNLLLPGTDATSPRETATALLDGTDTGYIDNNASTPEPIPETYFEFGTGPYDLEDPAAGLADLPSYRSVLILRFDGQRNGQPEQWSRTFELVASQQDLVFNQMIIQTAGQVDGQPLEDQYISEIAGSRYEKNGDAECQAFVVEDGAASIRETWEPARMLALLHGADEAGIEEINGENANHYTFDARALGLSNLGIGTGEVWVALEDGYLLKYIFTFEGSEEYFGEGEGVTGTLSWDYELLDMNQPASPDIPDDCPYGRVNVPLMSDAADVDETPGNTTYETAATPDEVIAFYKEQLPSSGWGITGNPQGSEEGGLATFAQGDSELTVFIFIGEDGKTKVWLILEGMME